MRNRILVSIILAWGTVLLAVFSPSVHAAVKDNDVDGLTDESEVRIYGTDPTLFDTDGDGIGDGEEIRESTNPLDPESSRLLELQRPDPGILGEPQKTVWYFGRATGILSFVLLTFIVVHGLIISSRAFLRYVSGALALEVHRFLSFLALGTILLHLGSFFFDGFFRLRLVEALVPFVLERPFRAAMGYDLTGSVGLGIIAFYLVLILIFTSEIRSKMPIRVWRVIHYGSFVAYPLFVLHGFFSGTDSGEWWMRALYIGSVAIVSLLIVVRIVVRNIIPQWKKMRARHVAENRPSSAPGS